MNAVFISLILLAAGGIAAPFCRYRERMIPWFTAAACLPGLAGTIGTVSGWTQPAGSGMFRLDALAALFLIPVFLVGALAAVHAKGYLSGEGRQGLFWLFFNGTLASMVCVALADTPVFFLLFWELMGVASFVLVAFEYHERSVQKAAWVYLLACHAGAVFLIPAFIFGGDGSWGIIPLVLGLIGFGLKAGFPLLHVWLPEAHPAAPAPVSAVMSGAMINLGFYGILRMPHEQAFLLLGWGLLVTGLTGALGGVFFAMAQRNLKRLLAYSSIENMGIIGIGLGLGFLGAANKFPFAAVCGFGGAFLHILNHAVLKGCLFLSAGSVLKATGTLNMDKHGGLQKRMPHTGTAFLYSSFALSGLPPFNAFLGELLIYCGAIGCLNLAPALQLVPASLFVAGLLILPSLALTGALAAAAFVKASAAVFLGEPRTDAAASAKERCLCMRLPLLTAVCISFVLLFAAPYLLEILAPVIAQLSGLAECENSIFTISMILRRVVGFSVFALLIAGGLLILRRMLPLGKVERNAPTWDCGYARPTTRMEYTGTAFIQPLADFFAGILHQRKKVIKPEGLFPVHAEITVETEDAADRTVWHPLFRLFGRMADKIHHLQSGYLHLYVLIMVLALLAMLVWAFFFHPEVCK